MATPKKRRRGGKKGRLTYGCHLTLNARGYYEWRSFDPVTGRRIKRSTGQRDYGLAVAHARKFERALARKKAGLRDYSCWRVELAPLVEDWAADLRCNEGGREVAISALKRALGELRVKVAAELDDVGGLDRRLKALAAKGYPPSVLDRAFQSVVKRFSRWLAENNRYIDRDPLANWKKIAAPAKGRIRPKRRAIDGEDFARVLLALDVHKRSHLRLAITTLLITGQREGALFERDAPDFDPAGQRIEFGPGNPVKPRGAGMLDATTANLIKQYLGDRRSGPLFLSTTRTRLIGDRFRKAWRAALSLATVDRFWPADEPRDLPLAVYVADALLAERPRVSKGGNPNCTSADTVKARMLLADRVAALAARLKDTWVVHMTGKDVHSLRMAHRTWARARGVLGEAIDAQLGHARHEDPDETAVLRAARGSRTGRRHYLDLVSTLFDPRESAKAVREVLDEATAALHGEGTSMLLPPSGRTEGPMAPQMAPTA